MSNTCCSASACSAPAGPINIRDLAAPHSGLPGNVRDTGIARTASKLEIRQNLHCCKESCGRPQMRPQFLYGTWSVAKDITFASAGAAEMSTKPEAVADSFSPTQHLYPTPWKLPTSLRNSTGSLALSAVSSCIMKQGQTLQASAKIQERKWSSFRT